MNEHQEQARADLDAMATTAIAAGFTLSGATTLVRIKLITEALQLCKGHQGRAAKLLGIHRNTLSRLVSLLKIEVPSQPGRYPKRRRQGDAGVVNVGYFMDCGRLDYSGS